MRIEEYYEDFLEELEQANAELRELEIKHRVATN